MPCTVNVTTEPHGYSEVRRSPNEPQTASIECALLCNSRTLGACPRCRPCRRAPLLAHSLTRPLARSSPHVRLSLTLSLSRRERPRVQAAARSSRLGSTRQGGRLVAMSMNPSDSLDRFMSRTGSSRGVTKQNGEIIALPHPVMKKSYAGNETALAPGASRCVPASGCRSRQASPSPLKK